MELLNVKPPQLNGIMKVIDAPIIEDIKDVSTDMPFIEANTEDTSLRDIRDGHIIPVFIKDNEPLISHADFIDATLDIVSDFYAGEKVLSPSVRVSHPIKGRIPEAKNKPASHLFENEKTIYFERMAFIIEVPSISDDIDGNTLSLTVGGVKAYNLDNLYSKKGTDEHFKIFVGFKNRVCTNLSVWTDGYMNDLKVNSIGQLRACIRLLLERYNAVLHLHSLRKLSELSLTEAQFAHLIGKCRMYHHLPKKEQNRIPQLLFGDNQIGAVCRDYYKDESFCRDTIGNINLWKLHNLFTGVNKSSYIDNFIDKSVNAYHFVEKLKWELEGKNHSWYLS